MAPIIELQRNGIIVATMYIQDTYNESVQQVHVPTMSGGMELVSVKFRPNGGLPTPMSPAPADVSSLASAMNNVASNVMSGLSALRSAVEQERVGPGHLDQLVGELMIERDWLRARNEALLDELKRRDGT